MLLDDVSRARIPTPLRARLAFTNSVVGDLTCFVAVTLLAGATDVRIEPKAMTPLYCVYASDRGSPVASEIAALVAEALGDLGYRTVALAPGLPEPGRDRVNLVVAPDEFFPHTGHSEPELLQAASVSVTLGVGQPGSPGFDVSAGYASAGPMALHISENGVDALVRRGINATHLQLGYHPSWDRWGGDPNGPRPADLLLFGSMTAKLDHLLSEAARLLWDCRAEIRLCEDSGPAGSGPSTQRGQRSQGQASQWTCWPLAASSSTFTLARAGRSSGHLCWRRSSTDAWS